MRYYAIAFLVIMPMLVSACGTGGEDIAGSAQDGLPETAKSAAADVEAAYTGLPDSLRQTAASKGELFCELSVIPGGRAAPSMDPQTDSFYTDRTPAEVAAFYRHAAEARGKTPQINALPGTYEIDLTPGDQSGCQVVVGQIQDGTTLVQVTPHDWASADKSR